jgi:hypothetical protein
MKQTAARIVSLFASHPIGALVLLGIVILTSIAAAHWSAATSGCFPRTWRFGARGVLPESYR